MKTFTVFMTLLALTAPHETQAKETTFTDITAALPGVEKSAVAWGDYDNDGDLDILLTGSTGDDTWTSRVYRNDAGGFIDIKAGLSGMKYTSVAWGDYDNDGDLDIPHDFGVYRNDAGSFIDIDTGLSSSGGPLAWGDYDNDGDLDILHNSSVYRNDAGSFVDIGAELEEATHSSVAWGDYDNDGDLDILLAGSDPWLQTTFSKVYRNDDGSYVDIGADLQGVWRCSVAWGDYDNDGDLDILLTGMQSEDSKVYRNDAGSFTDIEAGLPRVFDSAVAWGDYDNDGDLDILLTGYAESVRISRVYRNDAGSFTDIAAGVPGVSEGSVAWGDYDNDGDLDILLTGNTGSGRISRVYRNDGTPVNTPPAAPANPRAHAVGSTVTFSWDAVAGDETPSAGLTYNLRVGTTPGGSEIVSAMADGASGYRRVVQLGNAQQRTSWTVNVAPYWGTIYWSVQAVDAAYAGSIFSTEETVNVGAFQLHTALDGTDRSSVAWGDYDNDGDLDILLTGDLGGFPIAKVYRNDAGIFTDIAAGVPGVSEGSVAWGDYDNDGDLDILLTGGTGSTVISRVYRNEAGIFTDIAAGLPGVSDGSVAWGDYDNDGDLDILLTGWAEAGHISNVYRNDAGSFTDVGAGLPGVEHSSVAWGDYDNDGDLDILLTGQTNGAYISNVYRNDAESFIDIEAGLSGVVLGSAAWGDYDNDGDLDILLAGYTRVGFHGISRVYRNDAGSFTDIAAGLRGADCSSVAWGDYDNDGDLDILLTGGGCEGGSRISTVYQNDAGSFIDISAGLPGLNMGSVAWGDYDTDGDLDILLTGRAQGGRISSVYRSDGFPANSPPAAPTNLSARVVGPAVEFSWDAVVGDETPSAGLTYNLRVGTTPGGAEICGAMADASTGHRLVAALGNTNHRTTWTIALPDGWGPRLYWSVQAIDACFGGSAFAPEQVLVAVPVYLSYFEALREDWQVRLQWQVTHAMEFVGFHVFRQPSGEPRVQITETPITGQGPYEFVDWAPPAGNVTYWLKEYRTSGSSLWLGSVQVEEAIVEPGPPRLLRCFPNPTGSETQLHYLLPVSSPISLDIYDLRGRWVSTVFRGAGTPGLHYAVWDGTDSFGRPVSSGTYFVRIATTLTANVAKLVVIRPR